MAFISISFSLRYLIIRSIISFHSSSILNSDTTQSDEMRSFYFKTENIVGPEQKIHRKIYIHTFTVDAADSAMPEILMPFHGPFCGYPRFRHHLRHCTTVVLPVSENSGDTPQEVRDILPLFYLFTAHTKL